MFSPLVGGSSGHGGCCGLFCWVLHNTSSDTDVNRGARPLVLKIWDLMCVLRCCCLLLLSAVGGTILLIVACGIGIVIKRLLSHGLTAELDHLY